ncbi:phosphatase PAP2 family protein [Janibacter sp. RAF20_2_2]|uniref:phosphatase PAP2 family protein n=1 Tax=unclassified Janibacter TaxID=2649294 RepID=UPI003F8FF6DC
MRRPLWWASAWAALYLLLVVSPTGQEFDEWLLGLVQLLGPGPLAQPWHLLGRRVLPVGLVVLVLVLGTLRVRCDPWQVLRVGVLVGASTGLSLLLKQALPRPLHGRELGYLTNTFPSTHASATFALLVAVWWLWLPRPVWLPRLLCAAVGVAALGNVVGHAHRPSDVLGSALLVGVVANTLRAATSRRASGYSDDAHDRSTEGRAGLTGKDGCA